MEQETVIEQYARQMAEAHAQKIDENFWLVVKQKPKWMPSFLYRAVIKNLVEFQEHRITKLTDESSLSTNKDEK